MCPLAWLLDKPVQPPWKQAGVKTRTLSSQSKAGGQRDLTHLPHHPSLAGQRSPGPGPELIKDPTACAELPWATAASP